jgi:GNAT superfamily N-acetyltransferase
MGQVPPNNGMNPTCSSLRLSQAGYAHRFSVIWYDHLNRTGLFEPVGTHKDHRRCGFGRAIILYGMQQMAAAGMKFATVAHFGQNEAARGLYQACGFKPWYLLDGYKKHF